MTDKTNEEMIEEVRMAYTQAGEDYKKVVILAKNAYEEIVSKAKGTYEDELRRLMALESFRTGARN